MVNRNDAGCVVGSGFFFEATSIAPAVQDQSIHDRHSRSGKECGGLCRPTLDLKGLRNDEGG